jgi:hypothetical protein
MQAKPAQASARRTFTFWRITGVVLLLLALTGALVVHRIRQRIPRELMQDIRAGIAARNIKDADARFEKYLEVRYGPQSDPANREKVFLDFFNVEHIRAMQFLVRHSPANMRQANIDASARWVQQFREGLTPEQRADLAARLQAGGGDSLLAGAAAQYNSQDVRYRGQTAPVISQLLKTIAVAKHQ